MVVQGLRKSEDPNFEIVCIENRITPLIPVLKGIEKVLLLADNDSSSKESKSSNDEHKLKLQLITQLDSVGTKLWNIISMRYRECIELKNSKVWMPKFKQFGLLKFFSCLVLAVHSFMDQTGVTKLRVLRCFSRTYFEIIDEGEKTAANEFQHYIEKYIGIVKDFAFSNDEMAEFENLKVELSCLDMHYALTAADINMAKFFENKINLELNYEKLKVKSVLNISRVMYNSSLNLHKEGKHLDAIYFLERANIALEKVKEKGIKSSIQNSFEKINIPIISLLIQCYIDVNTEFSLEKAKKLIIHLDKSKNNKLEALKLQIKLLEKSNCNKIIMNEEIMNLIISFSNEQTYLAQLVQMLNGYSKKEPTIAKNCANYIFNNKIKFDDKSFHQLAQNLLIAIIWIITSQLQIETPMEKLRLTKQLIEHAQKLFIFKLSKETVESVIVMLWNIGKKRFKDQSYDEALEWFECCSTEFFLDGYDAHDEWGKIQRSMLQCCLEINNNEKFTKIFNEMSPNIKIHPLTLVSSFIFNVRCGNNQVAISILNKLSNLNDKNNFKLIALCVVEAIKYKKSSNDEITDIVNEAIKALLEKTNDENFEVSQVALRSCIYVYIDQLDKILKSKNFKNEDTGEPVGLICKIVAKYINLIESSNGKENQYSQDESEWYSSNCFNLAQNLMKNEILTDKVIQLFQCSITIIKQAKLTNCIQYIVKANICMAHCKRELQQNKSSVDVEAWKEIYDYAEIALKNIKDYDGSKDDIKNILHHCTILTIEGMIKLGMWSKLIQRIETLCSIPDYTNCSEEFAVIMELLAASFGYVNKRFQIMERIITKTFTVTQDINEKIFNRWIQMLFEFSGEEQCDYKIQKMVSLYFSRIAQSSPNSNVNEKDYELEWIAGKCWNKGVEIMLDEKESSLVRKRDVGKAWCELAMSFANLCEVKMYDEMLPKLLKAVDEPKCS